METFSHRYYKCPHDSRPIQPQQNDTYDDDDYQHMNDLLNKTSFLTTNANDYNDPPCLLCRGFFTSNVLSEPIDWQSESICTPHFTPNFLSLIHSQGRVGTDGSGGRNPGTHSRLCPRGLLLVIPAHLLTAPRIAGCQRSRRYRGPRHGQSTHYLNTTTMTPASTTM